MLNKTPVALESQLQKQPGLLPRSCADSLSSSHPKLQFRISDSLSVYLGRRAGVGFQAGFEQVSASNYKGSSQPQHLPDPQPDSGPIFTPDLEAMVIKKRCYARVGLLGNPSDGYFGKTISLSLSNYFAEVTLSPADDISVQPHPVHDLTHYPSLQDLAAKCNPHATYGGVRLLLSLCRCFFLYCSRNGLALPEHQQGFCLSYDTNIPRQAGLSGSSAIIAAGLQCLLEHFQVSSGIPLARRPSLVLEAETELGITAGLQDRVIQVYGGLVYMDFEQGHMDKHGHGIYEPLPTTLLPKLHLVFADNPSDSGKVHSTVRQRWLAGVEGVRGAMEEVASLAAEGREALLRHDHAALASLMNRNFDLRRKMFGDEALGSMNIDMVETARSVGAAAKFTGSGGAIVTLCLEGQEQIDRLLLACKEKGYQVVEITVGEPSSQSD